MPYDLNHTLWQTTFTDTSIFGLTWLIAIPVILLTLVLITRQTEKWKTLAFPVAMIWHIAGLEVHQLLFIILGIMFVIDSISLEVLGQSLEVIKRVGTGLMGIGKEAYKYRSEESTSQAQKEKQRIKDLEFMKKQIEEGKIRKAYQRLFEKGGKK